MWPLQAIADAKMQAMKAREVEIAHLRAQQERSQDVQAQRDELRARRSLTLSTSYRHKDSLSIEDKN